MLSFLVPKAHCECHSTTFQIHNLLPQHPGGRGGEEEESILYLTFFLGKVATDNIALSMFNFKLTSHIKRKSKRLHDY